MMALGNMDNDTRGWIMCIVSGMACVAGASIICIDVVVRLIPSQSKFSIQESNGFLASSLSLSFGVMLFSSLYSMLPSSKRYLLEDSWEEQAAGFVMMGLWVAGFVGIQILSRLLHQFMPSHVVDCDHTHGAQPEDETEYLRSHSSPPHAHVGSHLDLDVQSRHPSRASRTGRSRARSFRRYSAHSPTANPSHSATVPNEVTPLLLESSEDSGHARPPPFHKSHTQTETFTHPGAFFRDGRHRAVTHSDLVRRPSMLQVQKRVMSFVRDTKANCDEFGPCFGYTDPCGQECFKHLSSRSAFSRVPTMLRTRTSSLHPRSESVPEGHGEDSPIFPYRTSRAQSRDGFRPREHADDPPHGLQGSCEGEAGIGEGDSCSIVEEDLEAQHHHHVATNAFLSIGLQTVIAIALHKFPEGFVTYATNHANPNLGFNVFMALFVHNIAEGFSMALPLYMALGSRLKAILWSSLLGGLSQPMGAGLAVLWFKLANHSNIHIDNTAYACLFAATAGIMTSVALQLFVESLSLNHNRNLSIFFAFLGMSLMGLSNALVDD